MDTFSTFRTQPRLREYRHHRHHHHWGQILLSFLFVCNDQKQTGVINSCGEALFVPDNWSDGWIEERKRGMNPFISVQLFMCFATLPLSYAPRSPDEQRARWIGYAHKKVGRLVSSIKLALTKNQVTRQSTWNSQVAFLSPSGIEIMMSSSSSFSQSLSLSQHHHLRYWRNPLFLILK